MGKGGEVSHDAYARPAAVVDCAFGGRRRADAVLRKLPPPPRLLSAERRAARPRYLCAQGTSGTLCWRDGYKTGTSTPNGQDAYDGKLICSFAE